MKLVTAISFLALTVLTAAQDITSLPQCAQQPILNAITNSGCPLTDITCICGNEKFISGLLAQIPVVCNPAEVEATAQFAEDLCSGYGVSLDLTISGVAVGTSAAPSMGSSTSVTVPASTTAGSSTSATVPASTTASGSNTQASSSATPANTGAAAATSSTPPSAGTINSVGSVLGSFMVIVSMGAFMWT